MSGAHFHYRTRVKRSDLLGQACAHQIPGGRERQTDRQVRRMDGCRSGSRARPGPHVEPTRGRSGESAARRGIGAGLNYRCMLPPADGPATSLEQLHLTLRLDPLIDKEEFARYYRSQVNDVRGGDAVAGLTQKLQEAYGALPCRAFLMGHPGVGKSTEVTRLLTLVEDHYVGVRLSAAAELNPASFKIFDVLLLMLARLAEQADRMNAIPLEGILPAQLLSDIQQWFGAEQVKRTGTRTIGGEVKAGLGLKAESPWASLLGLFASATGEMKYAGERKKETDRPS